MVLPPHTLVNVPQQTPRTMVLRLHVMISSSKVMKSPQRSPYDNLVFYNHILTTIVCMCVHSYIYHRVGCCITHWIFVLLCTPCCGICCLLCIVPAPTDHFWVTLYSYGKLDWKTASATQHTQETAITWSGSCSQSVMERNRGKRPQNRVVLDQW
jgi:hypothetical protein